MDLDKIKSAVLTELTDTNGLNSLKLQNHIYGCFILMEDIAQGVLDFSGSIVSTSKFSFDLDKQFADIGIRYGFIMDTKLALNEYNGCYKEVWLQYFRDIDIHRDIDEVDKIEDCLLEVLQKSVKPEDGFFFNALDTGSLSQDWIEKALGLINCSGDNVNSVISHAVCEKPLCPPKKKHLAHTRRSHPKIVTAVKKSLAKTRRH
jgi:hypothetical protein